MTLVLLAWFAVPAFAQPSTPATRIPTVTRLVKVFSELETRLAVEAHGDADRLGESLDPAFEMRVGASPGVPVARDEWISRARAAPAAAPRIDQMAVHDLGDVALVSFRETAEGASTGAARAHFIVDCWKREGNRWKLAVRYLSDASSEGARAAGSKAIDKRY